MGKPTDFRVQTSWRRHRKRRRLQRILGADGVLAIEDMWSHAAEMHQDGVLVGMSAADMADEVGYEGDASRMLDAFVEVRLVDPPDPECPHFRLHDWKEHQPWIASAPERSVRASIAASSKWAKIRDTTMRRASVAHAGRSVGGNAVSQKRNAPSPSPSPSPIESEATTVGASGRGSVVGVR